jgi:hypothetical protein
VDLFREGKGFLTVKVKERKTSALSMAAVILA